MAERDRVMQRFLFLRHDLHHALLRQRSFFAFLFDSLCLRKRGSLLRDLKRVLQPLLLLRLQIGKLNGRCKSQLTAVYLVAQGLFKAVKPDIAMNLILTIRSIFSQNLKRALTLRIVPKLGTIIF